MVGTYGMSETLGPLAYDKQGGSRFLGGPSNPRAGGERCHGPGDRQGGAHPGGPAHDRALAILRHNRALLETISQQILEKEVIEGEDLRGLLASSVMPEEAALPGEPVASPGRLIRPSSGALHDRRARPGGRGSCPRAGGGLDDAPSDPG